MTARSLPRTAHLLLACTVVVWGGAFVAIKRLIDDGVGAQEIALARYLVAAPGFAIALVLAGGMRGITRVEALRVAVAGLLVVTIYHLALNQGEETTTAGTAAVIIACAPAITLAMAVWSGLEGFSSRRAAGLAVAFLGVLVVILLGAGEHLSASAVRGPLLVLAAAASFAAYNVIVKPLLPRHGAIAVTCAASLAGTAGLLVIAAGSGDATTSHLTGGGWALVAYLGLVCTLAAYLAWTLALRSLDASSAVAFLYGVPVCAVAIGALTLGEPVSTWVVAGGGMIVGGVAVAAAA
ncbi:MAG TPA: DMT family transporter [Gaiellales bacterium]|nr:DMT family transporter [Gaiellales bacterium]